ncbi:MAG: NrfD/PsrC family molybdoenzyme membrane anchor subunit [Bacillota bacterium]
MNALRQPAYVEPEPTAQPAPAGAHPALRFAWYAILFVLLLAGGYAIILRMMNGLTTTNLTSITPWGAWVAFYIYFVGLSAGAFLLSSMVYVFGMTRFEKVGRMALLTALVSMIVALTFIALDLGRMDRALIPVLRFNWLSPLAWEVRFYVIYILLLAAELVFAVKGNQKWLAILGTIGIPIAIFGVHGGTGAIFAVVKARGLWFGPLAPVLFIVSALVSGTALLTLFYAVRQRARNLPVDSGLVSDLGRLLAAFLLVDLGLIFYEFLVPALAMSPHEGEVIHTMTAGPYAWSFWILQLGLGMIAPAIILLSKLRQSWVMTALAAALVVVGIVGVRFNIVVPALIPPVLPGLPAGQYFPSAIEWLSSAGVIAMGLLIFSLAAERLPLDSEGGTEHV